MAYKFQNQELLSKLEGDLNLLEYSEQNEGNLRSERVKINEKLQKKYKYSDPEKNEGHPAKVGYAQSKNQNENDELFKKNLKVIRNIANMNFMRNGRMIPMVVTDKEHQGFSIFFLILYNI